MPWLRAWMMWAGVSFGAYLDFARLRFALLCLQLLAAFGLIYSAVLSLGGWKLPVPARVAALGEQVSHLPVVGSSIAGVLSLHGWKLAVPAAATLLWGSAFRIPLIGSFIGALIVPPLVLMAVLAGILWIPALLESLWCRLVKGERRPLPTRVRICCGHRCSPDCGIAGMVDRDPPEVSLEQQRGRRGAPLGPPGFAKGSSPRPSHQAF